MTKKLGIIAGDGRFPVILAASARENGFSVVAVAHTGLSSQDIEKVAERTHWINVGEVSRLVEIFKSEGITEAIMAGGVSKGLMFRNIKPDLRALSLLFKLKDRKDDTILRALANELEKEGIMIREATTYVKSILAGDEVLTRHAPSEEEWRDIAFGMKIAKEIGRLDIGQCIVVKQCAVLAVEAIEGTDEAIRRGGRLANGGAVVVKICKPGQDIRFDLPTIGPGTIETMKEVAAQVLAVEAGMTVVIDREMMIESADAAGIAVVGIQGGAKSPL